MNELALFAGAGGGILAGKLLGWRCVCAVEWEPYAACVLAARQNEGLLPAFPIWSDVRTFDGRPWRGRVDVVSGGFPCQDISAAGKGAGIDGERSGMWTHMARIIGEIRPRFAFVENSPMLLTRGLGRVLSDLAALGYDCRWTVLGADDVGAPTSATGSGWLPPTPSASHCETRPAKTWNPKSQSGRSLGCMAATGMWRTPSAMVTEPKSSVVKLTGRKPTDPQVGLADQVGGKLNPMWVEWLMGWPIGWTDLKLSATDKCQHVPPQPGGC